MVLVAMQEPFVQKVLRTLRRVLQGITAAQLGCLLFQALAMLAMSVRPAATRISAQPISFARLDSGVLWEQCIPTSAQLELILQLLATSTCRSAYHVLLDSTARCRICLRRRVSCAVRDTSVPRDQTFPRLRIAGVLEATSVQRIHLFRCHVHLAFSRMSWASLCARRAFPGITVQERSLLVRPTMSPCPQCVLLKPMAPSFVQQDSLAPHHLAFQKSAAPAIIRWRQGSLSASLALRDSLVR